MKVKYANGVESHVAPAIGKELVKAGIATEASGTSEPVFSNGVLCEAPHARPQWQPLPPATWAVVKITGVAKPYAAIQITSGQDAKGNTQQVRQWAGDPRYANARKTWDGGSRYLNGLGREIPADVLKLYVSTIQENPELLHSQIPGEAIAAQVSFMGTAPGTNGGWKGNDLIAADKDAADHELKAKHWGLKESGAI